MAKIDNYHEIRQLDQKISLSMCFLPCKWVLLTIFFNSGLLIAAPLQFNVDLAPFSYLLSQPNITALHKDTDGFLWIGTQAGLNKYDGSEITAFNSSDASKNWVPASYITEVTEDSKGTIWIATYGGGLARYNKTTSTFESPSEQVPVQYAFLKSLFLSSDGKVWFGTREAGIGMYDPSLDRYTSWAPPSETNQRIGQAEDFLEDELGHIWVAGHGGIYMLERDSHSTTFYPLPLSASSLRTVTAIEHGPQGTIWVGTDAGDLFIFNTLKLAYRATDSLTKTSKGWITDLVYNNEILWVAKDNGITVIDTINENSRTYSHSNSMLSSDFTLCLLWDKTSVLVGTARGLNIFASTPFEKYQSTNSQVFDDISAFGEDLNHRVWVGTFNGAYLFDETTKSHIPLESVFKNYRSNDNRITAIDIRGNDLWLGFFHGGVQIVSLLDGSVRYPNLPYNSELAITNISHTIDGSVWIGTYNQGLYRILDEDVLSYYHSNNTNSNIPEPSILFTIKTDSSRVLVGSKNSLYTIDYVIGRVNKIESLFPNSKSQPVITVVEKSRDSDIWIGIRDRGLFVLRAKNNLIKNFRLSPLKANAHLPSKTIYAIEFDNQGNAWISTTKGIAKLSSQGELVKLYTTADGLQGNDFNLASSFKDSKGRIYFGGSNGYNRFDPSHSTTAPPPPPVVLTELIIAGDEPALPVAIHKLKSIELSYLDYFVTLGFSVLDFVDPKNNRYRYKLENFDPNWIENGTRNSATYTNLPSGRYTFRVQGANSAGIWNSEGISIEIIVHPAPWFRWQAYLFYFLVLIGSLFLAKKYYDKGVVMAKATLMAREMHDAADKATDDLQEQLELQDDFVKVVHAHNENTLQLVSDFISQQADFVEDDDYREVILNNSNRVAALAKLESCLYYHGDELLANLEDFTNILISQLLEEAPGLASSITTINEIPSRLVLAEIATPLSLIIFELLENSFHHAFEHSSSANYIHIRLESIPTENQVRRNKFKLTVEDNGVGMPENLTSDTLESSGLAIVSSIARKLNGTIHISSAKGTSVSIVFSTEMDIS